MARAKYLQPGDPGFAYTTAVVADRLIVVEDEGVVRRERDGDHIGKELAEDGYDVNMPVLHVDDEQVCRRMFLDTEGRLMAWMPIPGAVGREEGVIAMLDAMAKIAARKAAREAVARDAAA